MQSLQNRSNLSIDADLKNQTRRTQTLWAQGCSTTRGSSTCAGVSWQWLRCSHLSSESCTVISSSISRGPWKGLRVWVLTHRHTADQKARNGDGELWVLTLKWKPNVGNTWRLLHRKYCRISQEVMWNSSIHTNELRQITVLQRIYKRFRCFSFCNCVMEQFCLGFVEIFILVLNCV